VFVTNTRSDGVEAEALLYTNSFCIVWKLY